MVIWLASYPRSGNSLLSTMLKHYFGIPAHNLYPMSPQNASHLGIIGVSDLPRPLEGLQRESERFFVKTHEIPTDDNPSVYIVRDGRDVLVSYAHYIRGFLKQHGEYSFNETLGDLISNPGYFHGWSAHVEAWTGRAAAAAVLRYETLVAATDPWRLIADAFSSIQINLPQPVTTAPPPRFDDLHRIQPDFFQRGTHGRWEREMPRGLQRLFMQHHGKTMQKLGYA